VGKWTVSGWSTVRCLSVGGTSSSAVRLSTADESIINCIHFHKSRLASASVAEIRGRRRKKKVAVPSVAPPPAAAGRHRNKLALCDNPRLYHAAAVADPSLFSPSCHGTSLDITGHRWTAAWRHGRKTVTLRSRTERWRCGGGEGGTTPFP